MEIHTPAQANRFIRLYDIPTELRAIRATVLSGGYPEKNKVQFLVQLLHSDECRKGFPILERMGDRGFAFITMQLERLHSAFKPRERKYLLTRAALTDGLRWHVAIKMLDDLPTLRDEKAIQRFLDTALKGAILRDSAKAVGREFAHMFSAPQDRALARPLGLTMERHPEFRGHILRYLRSWNPSVQFYERYRVCACILASPGATLVDQDLENLTLALKGAPQRLIDLSGSSNHQILSRFRFQQERALSTLLQMSDRRFKRLIGA